VYGSSSNQWAQLGQDLDSVIWGDNYGIKIAINDDGSVVAVGGDNARAGGSAVNHKGFLNLIKLLYI